MAQPSVQRQIDIMAQALEQLDIAPSILPLILLPGRNPDPFEPISSSRNAGIWSLDRPDCMVSTKEFLRTTGEGSLDASTNGADTDGSGGGFHFMALRIDSASLSSHGAKAKPDTCEGVYRYIYRSEMCFTISKDTGRSKA